MVSKFVLSITAAYFVFGPGFTVASRPDSSEEMHPPIITTMYVLYQNMYLYYELYFKLENYVCVCVRVGFIWERRGAPGVPRGGGKAPQWNKRNDQQWRVVVGGGSRIKKTRVSAQIFALERGSCTP